VDICDSTYRRILRTLGRIMGERFDVDGYRAAISRAEAEAEAEAETARNRARNFEIAARLFGREAIGYVRYAYVRHASESASKAATNYRYYCNVTAGRAYDDDGQLERS